MLPRLLVSCVCLLPLIDNGADGAWASRRMADEGTEQCPVRAAALGGRRRARPVSRGGGGRCVSAESDSRLRSD